MIIRLILLYIIILFSKGLFENLGVSNDFIDVFNLLLLLLAFLQQITKGSNRLPPGLKWVLLYSFWIIISSIYNNQNYPSFFQSRYIIEAYLLFYILINHKFSIRSFTFFKKTIIFIFVAQIITTILKLNYIGQVEGSVGTIVNLAGGLATTLPLFLCVIFYVIYLHTNSIIYICCIILSLMISYSSGKLGVYFILPFTLLISNYFFQKINRLNYSRNKIRIRPLIIFSLAIIIFSYSVNSLSRRTNHIEGSNTDKLILFYDYFQENEKTHTSKYHGKDYTMSRINTSIRIFEETFSRDIFVFLFGIGFEIKQSISGQATTGSAYEEYRIYYGLTGWGRDTIFFGWPAMIFHIMFYYSLLTSIVKTSKKHMKFKSMRTVLVLTKSLFYLFLINYIFYNNSYTVGGWVISLHVIAYAILFSGSLRFIVLRKFENVNTNLN